MVSISRKENDYPHDSAAHFIIGECESARTAQPFRPTLIMVSANGPCSTQASRSDGDLTFGEERYGEAFPADYAEHVVVLWANRRHVFNRESGRCVESPDGIMRSWKLHPFEVAKNERVGDSFGKEGEAPVSRVPTNAPMVMPKAEPPASSRERYVQTGTLSIGPNGAVLS